MGRAQIRFRLMVLVCSASATVLVAFGCAEQKVSDTTSRDSGSHTPHILPVPDTRQPIPLESTARKQHRAVMQQHLESVQQVVAALARGEYELAKGLTVTHLGFFKHRQAMLEQTPEDFPPAYHDLAMAHHEAAEELARVIPSQDLHAIMSKLDGVLKACVACHLAFKTSSHQR